MARLNLVVEGETEEGFANQVLVEHLAGFNVFAVARRVTTNRKTGHKGGMTTFAKAKGDLSRWLKQEKGADVFLTTMFDLYGLPTDFPKFEDAQRTTQPYDKVRVLEDALAADIADRRFVPHIQLHEFETLLFCDVQQLAKHYAHTEKSIERLTAAAAKFTSPELIDDGDATAPSKRIEDEFPRYQKEKPLVGTQIATDIGLANIRAKCRHFDAWITTLEQLGSPSNVALRE